MPTSPSPHPPPLITITLGLAPPPIFPFLNFKSSFQSLCCVVPPPFHILDTSPPPSAPRPAPRPGGRAPLDPLPSVSAAPQQIGGMVWDFLGK